jgi:hypothetical protein
MTGKIVLILSAALLYAWPSMASQECSECDYDQCNTDRESFSFCKRCDIPNNQYEDCRQGAEDAGFFKQAFKAQDKLADGKGYTAGTVSKNLENLKHLIWNTQKEIALLPSSEKKDTFHRNSLTTLQFWSEFKKETGITPDTDDDTPVKWAHERYTSILSSALMVHIQVTKAVVDHAKLLVKKKSGLKGKLFARKKLSLLKEKLREIEEVSKNINVNKSVEDHIAASKELVGAVNALYKILK